MAIRVYYSVLAGSINSISKQLLKNRSAWADVDGVEQLHRAAEHFLSQAGVNGEHGVVDMRVVALDVAQDGEEKLLHLVGGGLYAVLVALVGFGREVPVVAVARMEECGAVA